MDATEAKAKLPAQFLKRAKFDKPHNCWLWTGAKTPKGYGQFGWEGKTQSVHRFAYEQLVGPIPEGFVIDHVAGRGCKNRNCFNPAHLEAVTGAENIARWKSGHFEQDSTETVHCQAVLQGLDFPHPWHPDERKSYCFIQLPLTIHEDIRRTAREYRISQISILSHVFRMGYEALKAQGKPLIATP